MLVKDFINKVNSIEDIWWDIVIIAERCKNNKWIVICRSTARAQHVSSRFRKKWKNIRVVAIDWFDNLITTEIFDSMYIENIMWYEVNWVLSVLSYNRSWGIKLATGIIDNPEEIVLEDK